MAARDNTKKPAQGRETVVLPIGELSVTFKKPAPGQIAALRRAGTLLTHSDKETQGQGGLLFLDVLDNVVVDPAMLNRVYAGMADESIPLEDYADCAIALLKHFSDEPEEEAPRNGPISTRRASARGARR